MALVARAITSPELATLRSEGQWATYRAAILAPTTVYTARVNQTFTTTDKIFEITYDTGSGTLANVLADMTMLVGSTAGAHDLGICRVKSIDASKVYIGETSHISWADNLYLTIIRDWSLWARHVSIDEDGTPFMDGTITYSDQHAKFDPVPIMGSHRVLKLTGSTVSTQWNFSSSYVPGSTISSYATSAPSASATSGLTTSTPTTTFNTTGWHPVYFTPTAANGKSFWGVRWVYVWSDDDPPPSAEFPDAPRQEADSGGWQFTIRLSENADLSVIRERALVIVFAEDHYGSDDDSIGQLNGCENIVLVGWIGGEEQISWNPLQGQVSFVALTAHYWFSRIPSYPDGVKFTTRTPAAWTEIKELTVDKGLHHFFHWRTTATRIMDVSLTGDTKFTPETRSLASNLWEQIREIAFLQIFARAGVDRFNRLFVQVHPQLVPEVDRDWATVMTLTKEDLLEGVEFRRITVPPNAFVDLSGISFNSSGKDTPFLSISPGNTYPPYGSPEIVDHLLVASQANANELAGLYRGWLNNELPEIPVKLIANNRMIDCFPHQQCAITIPAEDTPRGIEYVINLIPKLVSFVPDAGTGYLRTEVTFEAETFADIAVDGKVPGSTEPVEPPPPPAPPPPLPIPVIPGGETPPSGENGPPEVLVHDTNEGLVYTSNFDEEDGANVNWETVNSGLTEEQYQTINRIKINPLTGEIYVARTGPDVSGGPPFPFIAYAPSIGSTFTILEDVASISAHFPGVGIPDHWAVAGIGLNPIDGTVAYILSISGSGGHDRKIYIGTGTEFDEGSAMLGGEAYFTVGGKGDISWSDEGFWRVTITANNATPRMVVLNADGSSIIRTVEWGGTLIGLDRDDAHIPISTSDSILMWQEGGVIKITQNGAVIGDFTAEIGTLINWTGNFPANTAIDSTGMLMMTTWDTGRRGRSTDGGANVVGIPNLPFGSDYAYDYAGSTGEGSRWVAARGIIRYSPDGGEAWHNKEGNFFPGIAPIAPNIDIIKVVRY